MADLTYVTYCGLYCGLCDDLARIPQQAAALYKTLRQGGWEDFGPCCVPGFHEFWRVLADLCRLGETCRGCRGGCGNPDCRIRACARERNRDLCSSCAEYPCERIAELARRYPNLVADGRRQQEIGVERWIREQEERRKAGFCYADIRHPT